MALMSTKTNHQHHDHRRPICWRLALLFAVLNLFSPSVCLAVDAFGDNNDSPQGDEGDRTGTIIGIDLGTTYSCVGVFQRGQVEIIPNDQGNRITPSFVAFSNLSSEGDDDSTAANGMTRLVGDSAKNQATINPENTIFDVKRLIGRKYSDPTVQADKKLLPYKIVDVDDRPHVSVTGPNGEETTFAPEEISSMVLAKLKADAERYLGKPIGRAVVTVPAYFNDAQRHATRDAGVIAGLHVERIINEPTAAAIAYGINAGLGDSSEGEAAEQNVLVFDLGGGTFDVTLLTIDNGVFEVLATNGDTHLGGSDFDQNVMNYFISMIGKKMKKDVIGGNKRALQKLRKEVERVKRALSSQLVARLDIEDIVPGVDVSETLTRAKFEELNAELFGKTLIPVKRVMEDAGFDIDEVDQIILVGGSTRIPRIQQLVSDFFKKEPNKGINPDESVAIGAAIQGSILSGDGGDLTNVILLDVAPLSLGTETTGGVMTVLIKRGTTIPTESSMDFYTVEDHQTKMTIDVYEGERSFVKQNHLLGLFDMTDLPPAPRGDVGVKVTFKIDSNGILEVTAVNLATQSKKKITITAEDGRLSEDEIEAMVKDAERFAEEDKREAARVEARNELESKIYRISSVVSDNEEKFDDKSELKELMESLDEVLEWLDNNQGASKEDFNSKMSEIDSLSKPFFQKLYSKGAGTDDFDFDDEL